MFEFTADKVPAQGRPAEENPYVGFVASVIEARKADAEYAATAVIPHPIDSAEVKKVRRFLAKASNAAGVSGRVSVQEATKGGKAGTKLTFWTVPKITRKATDTVADGLASA